MRGPLVDKMEQAMNKFTVTMRKERETKNAVRFQEVKVEGQPEKIGAQYIQKTAFGNGAPEEIKIEVSW